MYTEDELRPISALQHLLFCERQCALIHIEQVWAENRFTAEGNQLHKKAHDGKPETRDGVRITRGLPLHSFRWGLVGQADVIHWQPPADQFRAGVSLAKLLRSATPEQRRDWLITPVEYKRGKPKKNDCDRVQLCAQALCLEEMLDVVIPSGDLFYGEKRRRVAVAFDEGLRETTCRAASRLHELLSTGVTPIAKKEKKCDTCSLLPICMPAAVSRASAKRYFDRCLDNHLASATGPEEP